VAEVVVLAVEGTLHVCGNCGEEIVASGPWLHIRRYHEMRGRPRGRSSSSMRKVAERCRDKAHTAIEARLRLDSYEGTVWVGIRTQQALAYRFGARSDRKPAGRTPWVRPDPPDA
jgi:hypothetical protein